MSKQAQIRSDYSSRLLFHGITHISYFHVVAFF